MLSEQSAGQCIEEKGEQCIFLLRAAQKLVPDYLRGWRVEYSLPFVLKSGLFLIVRYV